MFLCKIYCHITKLIHITFVLSSYEMLTVVAIPSILTRIIPKIFGPNILWSRAYMAYASREYKGRMAC